MSLAALFVIASKWKQPKYPLKGKLISKLWYIHTIEYYPTINRIELVTYITAWMNLKNMLIDPRRRELALEPDSSTEGES